MRTCTRIAIAAAVALVSTASFANPFSQGMVGGQLKSNVTVQNVTQTNRATLGYAAQELNVGSVNGGKALGNVELNVQARNISQNNRATLGYASQEANIGSLK